MAALPEYLRSAVDADEWEPFVLGGVAYGEVHWIRTDGSEGAVLNVGLWRAQPPTTFSYPFLADETHFVFEGELVIDLVESEKRVVLRPGDIISFKKGTKSVWTVTQPFMKLFIISG